MTVRMTRARKADRDGSAARAAALQQALRLLPDNGDLNQFATCLSKARGRTVHVIYHLMPQGAASGLWISTRAADYVVIDAKAGPARASAILCHEVAHMILGHTGHKLDENQLAAALAPQVAPDVAVRFLAREHYELAQEQDAEEVGTMIAAEHARRQRSSQRDSSVFVTRLR